MTFKADLAGIRQLGEEPELREFMDDIGQRSVGAATDLVPVEFGDLRDSIGHEVDREDGAWMVHVFFTEFYGMFHEFPTTIDPTPHPFLRPGVLKVIGPLGGRLGDTGRG